MITALDQNTALVLIDLQKGILGQSLAHSTETLLANAARLLDGFHREQLPVVIVNVNPVGAAWVDARADSDAVKKTAQAAATVPGFDAIVPEILVSPTDIRITKKTWNAFYATALHEELLKRGVTGIVLGGVATSIGVEGTARAASERGYNISFAIDAMTDRSEEAHQHSITNIFPRIGESGTTEDILAKLKNRVAPDEE